MIFDKKFFVEKIGNFAFPNLSYLNFMYITILVKLNAIKLPNMKQICSSHFSTNSGNLITSINLVSVCVCSQEMKWRRNNVLKRLEVSLYSIEVGVVNGV